MKKYVASADRNREAIHAVLVRILPAPSTVLEVGSGTGQHATFLAGKLPSISWLPSDSEEDNLDSIAAYRRESGLPNLRSPLHLDVRRADWELPELDPPLRAILAIDVVSVAPWPVCVGLFTGAGKVLPTGGKLILHGSSWPRPGGELDKVARSRDLEPADVPGDHFLVFRRV